MTKEGTAVNRELTLLRYGLIVIPALITMHIQEYADYELFTLHLLILLLLVVMEGRMPLAFRTLLSGIEMLLTAWLCSQYGPLMIFPAMSSLLLYSQFQPRSVPTVFTAVHLIALNAAFHSSSQLTIASINLAFLLAACLMVLLRRAMHGQAETLFLYDELRKRHFELDEARTRLQQFAAQVENTAQSEERVRIARQLHDDIGHRLIRVKMMMEAAIHTLPSSPDTGMALMVQIRDQLSSSLDDMRAAVRRINYAPQLEGAYALDRLLEETGRDTGIVTSYKVEGMPFQLYPSLQIVLYKNAREAITNGLRHGKATAISIKLGYSPSEVTMAISNNGLLPHDKNLLQNRGGMGLKGMEERTSLVGGTLELRLEPEFTLITRLPVYKQSEIL
ncbi:sensor histidine kinase [Paenibacillus sp. GCM10012306]|uniref:sensor histidine kinase n=1 Tax=Paenibacillus sp. GCM10012306 TaxID=3317342 RepID=UPI00362451D3